VVGGPAHQLHGHRRPWGLLSDQRRHRAAGRARPVHLRWDVEERQPKGTEPLLLAGSSRPLHQRPVQWAWPVAAHRSLDRHLPLRHEDHRCRGPGPGLRGERQLRSLRRCGGSDHQQRHRLAPDGRRHQSGTATRTGGQRQHRARHGAGPGDELLGGRPRTSGHRPGVGRRRPLHQHPGDEPRERGMGLRSRSGERGSPQRGGRRLLGRVRGGDLGQRVVHRSHHHVGMHDERNTVRRRSCSSARSPARRSPVLSPSRMSHGAAMVQGRAINAFPSQGRAAWSSATAPSP